MGGTFANLSDASINIFVEVGVGNTLTTCNNIPVPQGSSFVISDAVRQFFRTVNKLEFIVIPQMPLMLI